LFYFSLFSFLSLDFSLLPTSQLLRILACAKKPNEIKERSAFFDAMSIYLIDGMRLPLHPRILYRWAEEEHQNARLEPIGVTQFLTNEHKKMFANFPLL
jgi:hypothetical protein